MAFISYELGVSLAEYIRENLEEVAELSRLRGKMFSYENKRRIFRSINAGLSTGIAFCTSNDTPPAVSCLSRENAGLSVSQSCSKHSVSTKSVTWSSELCSIAV